MIDKAVKLCIVFSDFLDKKSNFGYLVGIDFKAQWLSTNLDLSQQMLIEERQPGVSFARHANIIRTYGFYLVVNCQD